MMYRFSRSMGRKAYVLFLYIGMIVLLVAGIFRFSQANTILAQEIQYMEHMQEVNQATTLTLETRQTGQDETYIHIIAVGTVIFISCSTAGILILIKKRVKAAKKIK